jgi:hypothetical protein
MKSQVERQSKGESKPLNQKAVKPGHQMDVSPRPTFENNYINNPYTNILLNNSNLRVNDDGKKPTP